MVFNASSIKAFWYTNTDQFTGLVFIQATD